MVFLNFEEDTHTNIPLKYLASRALSWFSGPYTEIYPTVLYNSN